MILKSCVDNKVNKGACQRRRDNSVKEITQEGQTKEEKQEKGCYQRRGHAVRSGHKVCMECAVVRQCRGRLGGGCVVGLWAVRGFREG